MLKPYDFQNIIAIKILIKKDDQILLIREPEFNDWMPNRLGLPGGKPLINETLQETVERKIKSEVGLEISIKGIVRIIDIIMPEKTVYHIVLAAEYESGELGINETESDDIQWYSRAQLADLSKNDYTEYYNDELISQYLDETLAIIPVDLIQSQDNRTDQISEWMSKGRH